MFLLLRLVFGLISLALVALPLGLVALALAVPQAKPLLAQAADPTPAALSRARGLLQRHDPRRLPPGTQGQLQLTQGDVDLALAALPQVVPGLRARLTLAGTTAHTQLTLPLPPNPLGAYLNVQGLLGNGGSGLNLRQLCLGPVAVPDVLAAPLAQLAWHALRETADWGVLAQAVEQARIENGSLTIRYRVPDKLPEHLGNLALGTTEIATLRAYHDTLAHTLGNGRAPLPLPGLLAPLFQQAQQRGGDAAEYRAALLVAGAHLAGQSLAKLSPEARTWPPLPPRVVTLAGRVDSAQHFAVSALLAAHAGTPLAHAVGLWKEVEDSRGGSGFSFADLAADEAGTRLGRELAAGAPRIGPRLAAGVEEAALVPKLNDLPENLSAAAFRTRYGQAGDPRYEALVAEIERRVAALPLYR